MHVCILNGGCVNGPSHCMSICMATQDNVTKHGLAIMLTKPDETYLGIDACRTIARNAADAYRIIGELGGARQLRAVALNRCIEIMDMCELVVGPMDGRPDR